MKNWMKIASIGISALCIGVLVYLIFFFGGSVAPDERVVMPELKDYTISFDSDELEYFQGIDFLQGVTAVDENGVELTEDITVSCKPTDRKYEKLLIYSINKAGYKITEFSRVLKLDSSYKGVSVKSTGETLEIPINRLDSITERTVMSELVITDDGFGNACSISVYLPKMDEIGDYVATVTAANIFGDTAECKLAVNVVEAENTTIRLSASSVSLAVGNEFNASDYIVSANHSEYGDVSPYIEINSDVDTSKSGVYTVEYSIKGISQLKDEKAFLYVTVM